MLQLSEEGRLSCLIALVFRLVKNAPTFITLSSGQADLPLPFVLYLCLHITCAIGEYLETVLDMWRTN